MKKIEFLKKLFKTENVQSTDCGQRYDVNGYMVWVDTLGRGRISVKVKYFRTEMIAKHVAKTMYENLLNDSELVVDAATKWDVYHPHTSGARFPNSKIWVARLKCDKVW